MSNCIDIILSSSSCDKVKLICDRIRFLFDVEVIFLSIDSMTVDQEKKLVRLKSIMNEKVNLEKSKDYLLSACGEDITVREKIYSAEAYDRALSMRDDVERKTGVLLHYRPEHNMVLLTGQESCVEEAARLLDSAKQGLKQCRLLESEDSSYDSDYDATESEFRHDDVSRTVSDTLAAEYADYITGGERRVPDLQTILSDVNYTSKVEFSLKLGYTEYQVQTALQKLGPQPSQNELLAELIKLGATAKSDDRGSDIGDESSDAAGDLSIVELRPDDGSNLRHVVIDGSNVAISHGNKEWFSCRGIKLCIDWFRGRGHRDITVFVPRWRKEASRPDAPIKDQDILVQLEKERLLVFTPSRYVGGRRMVCYDDRYVLKLAVQVDGIIVSNDNYRDLTNENPEFKKVVEERLLMYSFVNDRFMPPDDPLGRHGPSLDNFLRKQPKGPETLPPPCPYGKKCTYGNKCKYYHPERGNQPQKSITERLAEQAKIQLQEVKSRGLKSRDSSPGDKLKITQSLPSSSESPFLKVKKPLSRTRSVISSTLLSEQLASEQSLLAQNLETAEEGSNDQVIISTDQTADHPPTSLATHLLTNLDFNPPTNDIHNVEVLEAWSPLPIVSSTSAQTSCSSSWATISPTLPKNISGPRVELFLEPDRGGHLSVAKKLSDPDNISGAPRLTYSQVPTTSSGGASSEDNTVNLHRKLQRQLTLNPVCDPRLLHLRGYVAGTQRMLSPQPEHFNVRPQPSDHPLLIQRASSQENIHSHGSYTNYTHRHQHITRLGSDSRVALSITPQLQPWESTSSGGHEHHSVTRIASAPDSYRQWPPSTGKMQRLNSTSDTRLNMYPDIHTSAHQLQLSCPQGSGYLNNYLGELPAHQWLLQTADSVPMTSTGLQIIGGSTSTQTNTTAWPETMHCTGIGISHLTQPVRPSSVPPQGMQMATMSPLPTPRTPSPDIPDDTRYRLYYHLSSIFPEEQVRAAMEMYPEETNPQKICAAILTLYPK